jgi:hypothetical protein
MKQAKLWGGLVVIFLAGAVTGIVGTTWYHQSQHEHRWMQGPAAKQQRVMKWLTRELSLSSAQQTEIEPMVSQIHLEILRLRFEHQPEVEQILTKGIASLKTKLSETQQAKLDALYDQLQERWDVSRGYLRARAKGMMPGGLGISRVESGLDQ